MADVFVSYKAEDRRRVKALVDALEADGFSVWWDEQISGGAAWRHTIEAELNDAKCVLVAWSKRSVGQDGTFVQDEATRAQQRHVYVPVLIDKVHLPLGFGEMQALPLSGWNGERSDKRYQAVLAAVRRVLGIAQGPAGPAASPALRMNRRTAIAGGTAATIAVAGIGAWAFLKAGAGTASNSIAVLPFANLSGDPGQAYFSDGIAEELRNALSRIPDLEVMARTSSEKVRNDDVQTAARKLRVASILTGSVRRSPSTIRVNAQLVDGEDGLERWSQSFDRPAGDLLQIQADIAASVAEALSIRLGSDRSALTLGGTKNPAAQDLLLQVTANRASNRAGLEQNLALLDAAIALDPNYAEAYARKAFLLMVQAGTYALSAREAARGHSEAMATANRAIAIAPGMGLGYAVRGNILRQQLKMQPALADARRATELPGNNVDALGMYSLILAQNGRSAEALRLSAKIISLDPLNPISHENQAVNLYYARRYAEAIGSARRSLELAAGGERARTFLGHALLALGKPAEAAVEYAKLDPTDYRRLLGQAVIAARAGQRSRALENLQVMERELGDSVLYQFGEIHSQLGDIDEALKQLDLAYAVRDSGLSSLRVDPFLDPVRVDPRYKTLERKIGFS